MNRIYHLTLFFILQIVFVNMSYSQIKVLSGGRVGIGTNDVTLSKFHVFGENYSIPLLLTNTGEAYSYTGVARSQSDLVKNWVVVRRTNGASAWGAENFFVYSSGICFGYSYLTLSDLRLKKNLAPIRNPLEKLMLINGYYYNLKPLNEIDSSLKVGNYYNRQKLGFVAQEIAQVVPEVVDTSSNGVIGVSYQELIPLLVESIKLQQIQINELKNIISKKSTSNSVLSNNSETSFGIAEKFSAYLFQNIPNPASGITTINYEVSKPTGNVAIVVCDINGKLIKKYENLPIGNHSIEIKQCDFNSGLYFYSLTIDGVEFDTKKFIID